MTFTQITSRLIHSGKNLAFLLLALLMLFTASCRPEKIVEEEYKPVFPGTFRVQTDYPYYYVVYRYGKMQQPVTIMVRQQKYWEHEFTTGLGDSLFLEVHTITSNVTGTKIKADIVVNGKTIQKNETFNECFDGDCYQAKPLDLVLDAVTE